VLTYYFFRNCLTCTRTPTTTLLEQGLHFTAVTGQLADKPTRGQSSRGLVNSPKCLIYNLQYNSS